MRSQNRYGRLPVDALDYSVTNCETGAKRSESVFVYLLSDPLRYLDDDRIDCRSAHEKAPLV